MSERAKKQWMLAASAQTPGVLNVSARGADIRALLNANPEVRDGSQITRESSTIVDRSVNTLVRVPDGGMVVIGGLLQEREERVETGVPVLSHILLLGGLFRDTTGDDNPRLTNVLIRHDMPQRSLRSML